MHINGASGKPNRAVPSTDFRRMPTAACSDATNEVAPIASLMTDTPVPSSPEPVGFLLVPQGKHLGMPAMALSRPVIVIGSRSHCRIHLNSSSVSRAHALLVKSGDSYYIRDLASRTHVFVDGQRVHDHALRDGELIKIGSFVLKFVARDAQISLEAGPRPQDTLSSGRLVIGDGTAPVPIVGRALLIGTRSGSDLTLPQASVSGSHAVIFEMDGRHYVRDLGSRTGTFVNRVRVHQQLLNSDDLILVGETDLLYRASSETEGVQVPEPNVPVQPGTSEEADRLSAERAEAQQLESERMAAERTEAEALVLATKLFIGEETLEVTEPTLESAFELGKLENHVADDLPVLSGIAPTNSDADVADTLSDSCFARVLEEIASGTGGSLIEVVVDPVSAQPEPSTHVLPADEIADEIPLEAEARVEEWEPLPTTEEISSSEPSVAPPICEPAEFSPAAAATAVDPTAAAAATTLPSQRRHAVSVTPVADPECRPANRVRSRIPRFARASANKHSVAVTRRRRVKRGVPLLAISSAIVMGAVVAEIWERTRTRSPMNALVAVDHRNDPHEAQRPSVIDQQPFGPERGIALHPGTQIAAGFAAGTTKYYHVVESAVLTSSNQDASKVTSVDAKRDKGDMEIVGTAHRDVREALVSQAAENQNNRADAQVVIDSKTDDEPTAQGAGHEGWPTPAFVARLRADQDRITKLWDHTWFAGRTAHSDYLPPPQAQRLTSSSTASMPGAASGTVSPTAVAANSQPTGNIAVALPPPVLTLMLSDSAPAGNTTDSGMASGGAMAHLTTPPAMSPATQPVPLGSGRSSRIIDKAVKDISAAGVPPRPAPIIELGNPFFGSGKIEKGIELPTGAVWAPTFILFGTYQSVFQAFENPRQDPPGEEHQPRSEWANRLDLYGNLQLTGSERVLVGIRPFDNGEFARPQLARYTGYNFTPDDGDRGWVDDSFNARITTLFFEGDLGQLFPNLDPYDTKQLDIGFSVGRQPLLYQDGMFINDDVDAIGITRNNFVIPGGSNMQISGVYAWNQINRGDGIDHGDPGLLGLFFNADIGRITWNLDTACVLGTGDHGDGAYAALSATQRIGVLDTTFRILGSQALEGYAPPGDDPALSQFGNGSSAVGTGELLASEVAYTPAYSKDLVYLDSYWGINRFTSAARGPDRGGPLGRVGILFAEQPIGRYGSALSSDPERSFGAALGYQKFLDPAQRKQVIVEIGGRAPTDGSDTSAAALGARYQQAFGHHLVVQLDAFGALNEGKGVGYGGRLEFRVDF